VLQGNQAFNLIMVNLIKVCPGAGIISVTIVIDPLKLSY